MNTSTNKLANERSLYLRQHAKNPVAWRPWCPEALDEAKVLNKPILLSIGYAACHWCHVMAHESFEDQETAAIMNKYFINIKVDREERPDLDKIYQTALQLLTGKTGGWPLTMFLTPDNHIPFFGGTYFSKRAGFGMPSFKEVLQRVHIYFTEHAKDAESVTTQIGKQLQQLTDINKKRNVVLNSQPLSLAIAQSKKEFDQINGGFGSAPKFPMPAAIGCLMRNPKNIGMAAFSLEKMAKGGIYDQIGGGFYRYSVDEGWIIPHFEKMLYDNAALLELYSQLYIATRNALFKNIALETGSWVLNEMQSSEGGFYATLNADSEGVEGKFYVWDREEIKKILTTDEYKLTELYFNLLSPENFEGLWHLHRISDINKISAELQLSEKKVNQLIDQSRIKLLACREKRIHPDRDEKILTAWNGLMIKALVIAGQSLDQKAFIDAAILALNFIIENCWHKKRLYAVYNDGQTHLMGCLDDYAFLLDAVITVLQYQWSNQLLQFAVEIAESLYDYFYDKKNGAFFFTAHDHEKLIQRPKLFMDESIPSGNGVAAICCLRLGYMLGNEKYLEIAEETLQVAWHMMNKYPTAYHTLLFALEEICDPPAMIILRGSNHALLSWQKKFYQHYHPHHLCFAIPNEIEVLPGALKKPPLKSGVNAYICQGKECHTTLQSLEEFTNYIADNSIESYTGRS